MSEQRWGCLVFPDMGRSPEISKTKGSLAAAARLPGPAPLRRCVALLCYCRPCLLIVCVRGLAGHSRRADSI